MSYIFNNCIVFFKVCFVVLITKSCPIFATPRTVACQAHLFIGFPRQEYGMGCHSFLQGIFPIQGLNQGLMLGR